MSEKQPEAPASILSELLFYHAALGRGYISPFPSTKGLVFTSALSSKAIFNFALAEKKFRAWHNDKVQEVKKFLEEQKNQPPGVNDSPEMIKKIKEMEAQVSKLPNVTWKEERASKSDLVDLIQKSYYGAITYFDATGARLAATLSGPHSRLASDLSLHTLTEGTTDETLIRSSSTGGACIHSLSGGDSIFNFISNSHSEKPILQLRHRIRDSMSGVPGIGNCVLIPGKKALNLETSPDTIHDLMMKVFIRGELDESQRVKVVFSDESRRGWDSFLSWGLADVIGETGNLAEWQTDIAERSPASPELSVLFGARASLVYAFIESAEGINRGGQIQEVVLDHTHLKWAQRFAKLIYVKSSGHDKFLARIENLKHRTGKNNYLSVDKINTAKRALEEAITGSEDSRIPRNQIRGIKGVTLGLLDELVRRGDITELRGRDECRLGCTTRAYTLPYNNPGVDESEALDELQEAFEMFQEDPAIVGDADAMTVYSGLREKAQDFYQQHFMPVVPISRMSSMEIRAVPRLLEMYPDGLLLRGNGCDMPEPENLVDEDSPLDIAGANLWVRRRPSGHDFCDWSKAGKLKLQSIWQADEEDFLAVVP